MALGRKTGGGSRRGRRNKATVARELAILASGKTPLEYLLGVMRDENADPAARLEAARAAAPYVHPRLAAVQHTGDEAQPIRHVFTWEGEEPS